MVDPHPLEVRLQQSKEHYSHPSFIFGSLDLTGLPLIDEYLASLAQTILFGFGLYLLASSLSYWVFFRRYSSRFTPLREDLRQYQEQIAFDIKWSFINILGQAPLVAFIQMVYPYYSKIQYDWHLTPVFPFYLAFHIAYDEFLTYWAHRTLHQPLPYRLLHSIHHSSKSVTPFSGFAFHPLDAFAQSLPVFTSWFFVPLPIDLVLAHGILTSLWAISIHDNVNMVPFKGILYAGCHSIHHFPWGQNYNYGKISSVCDRLYGSYCDPEGISGYGYTPGPLVREILARMNRAFEQLVPDKGKQRVEEESRHQARLQVQDKLGSRSL